MKGQLAWTLGRVGPTIGLSKAAQRDRRAFPSQLAISAAQEARGHAMTGRQGLRPVQIWVPDVEAPEFVAKARRQSAAIAASEHDADDQEFVDAISWDWNADEDRPE